MAIPIEDIKRDLSEFLRLKTLNHLSHIIKRKKDYDSNKITIDNNGVTYDSVVIITKSNLGKMVNMTCQSRHIKFSKFLNKGIK